MSTRMPPMDREAIRGLLALVEGLGAAPRPGVPLAELLEVPARLPGGAALTVDFALGRELGRGCIVLQVPAAPALAPDPRLDCLTAREAEVAALVATGLSDKRIAARLTLATATIKSHVHHILAKTGLPNRAAVAAAMAGRAAP